MPTGSRSRRPRPQVRVTAGGLVLAGVMALGCPVPEPEGSSASATTSTSVGSTGTSGSATGSTTADDTTADTTADGTTEGASESSGEPCELFEYTEVEGCPEAIGEQFCSHGGVHIRADTEIMWESNPPHSGDHWPMWASWGEYDSTLERERWVHNLEHGGIVLGYRCPEGCDAELEILRQVMEQRPELRIILTPDPELPEDGFAAISWTWIYGFASPDLDTLLCFVDQHENHAPEDVP